MKHLKRILMYVFVASISTSYAQDDYFVGTWDTRLSGEVHHINLRAFRGIIDVDTDMDGTFDLIGIERSSIGFTFKGIYTIAIRPNVANTTPLEIVYLTSSVGDKGFLRIEKWGSIAWGNLSFYHCTNLTIADDAGVPNLTMCNYISFFRATSFVGNNLSTWDVSNVADMQFAFSGATSFNGDLSSWNVSNVTSMEYTFNEATSFNGDLSNWDVSNVTDMDSTFNGATSFNGDLSTWDVSNVTDMFRTLASADSFSSENYDALLTGWASLPSLQPNVFFSGPTTYCAGKAGRDKLTRPVADGGYGWIILDLGEGCSPVTSVDEEFLSNTKIYPNPTRGKLTIESSFEIDKLELYNILGVKLFSVSKTNVLDLTSLRQGIYILKVFSKDRVVSKKVIKD